MTLPLACLCSMVYTPTWMSMMCMQLLIEKIHEAIIAKNRHHCTIWFSLNDDINRNLRAHDPSLPNITSVSGLLKVLVLAL